ncbi:hypothetical protein I8H83_05260 [Candidatus Saccharibacteria bacterium]|nr:hypothetical protein [Candidatus Saccharibacteria bacterium]MBH2007983.1 hypothetical protein [Candidatus Saccharibacteria bacterium]
MAQGSDTHRKITRALKACGGRATGKTVADIRKILDLQSMRSQDFKMNLEALRRAGKLRCVIAANSVEVELP